MMMMMMTINGGLGLRIFMISMVKKSLKRLLTRVEEANCIEFVH